MGLPPNIWSWTLSGTLCSTKGLVLKMWYVHISIDTWVRLIGYMPKMCLWKVRHVAVKHWYKSSKLSLSSNRKNPKREEPSRPWVMVENCSFNSTFSNITCGAGQESGVTIWVTTEEAIGIAVLSACSAIVGSVGNLLVLVALATSRYLRTVPDFFIVSLSLADVLVTAIAQPMLIYQTFFYPLEAKMTRSAFNETSAFVGHLALLASVTSMTAVTLDRLVAIRFALRYTYWVTARRSAVVIMFTWLVSLAMTLLYTVPRDVDRMGLWAFVTINLLITVSIYVYIFSVARRQANNVSLHSVFLYPNNKRILGDREGHSQSTLCDMS